MLAAEKGDARGRASLTSKPLEPDDRNAREEEPRVPRDKEVTAGRRAGTWGSESSRFQATALMSNLGI